MKITKSRVGLGSELGEKVNKRVGVRDQEQSKVTAKSRQFYSTASPQTINSRMSK